MRPSGSNNASGTALRTTGLLHRQKTADSFLGEASIPLLRTASNEAGPSRESDSDHHEHIESVKVHSNGRWFEMKFFDNLRGWDRPKIYRYMILFALSLSGDGWSYEAGVIASIFQLKAWVYHMTGDPSLLALPEWQNQWVGPVYSLGQLVGGFMAAYVLDTFGRKWTLAVGGIFMEVSTSLLIWSPSFGVVIAARVLEGVSIGFLLLGYQIYAVEVAAKEDRGFVSSFSLITGNFFGLLAAGIIYGITYVQSNSGWRGALAVTYFPATVMLLVLPWIPESPRFYYQHGKEERCRQVLARLYGGTITGSGLELSPLADSQFDAMKAAIDWDQKHGQDKWSGLWATKAARYRSFVAISSQCIWAWNGQSIFTYYYTIAFRAAGIKNYHLAFGISALQNAMWCVGSIIGGYLLDIWGRRTSYLVGIGQMGICLVIQGAISIAIFDKGIENHAAGAGFVTIYIVQWWLWVQHFSPVVNMLPAEVYSAGLRARGYAIANAFSMAVGFITQYTALPMYDAMNGYVWIFFACCMFAAFAMVFFLYPETKGITLEEVEVVFGSGAGLYVRQALGRRSSVHEDDNGIEGNAVSYNGIPKLARGVLHAPPQEDELPPYGDDVAPTIEVNTK